MDTTERPDTRLHFEGQGRTHQEAKDQCDINIIVKKYRRTRQVTHINEGQPFYGDFSNSGDYLSAVNQVREAELAFAELPAAVRKECDNDPGIFMEMTSNQEDLEILRKAGLNVGAPVPPAEPVDEKRPEPTTTSNDPPAEPNTGDDK